MVRVLICSLLTIACFGAGFSSVRKPGIQAFEARDGHYVSHGGGYALIVDAGGGVFNVSGHLLRMSFVGASSRAVLEPLDRMPGQANYLLGRDIRTSYVLYGRVRQRGVYAGVNVVFRGGQDHLEYDFEVGAGRDPQAIRVRFEGADEIRIDTSGALVLRVGNGEIRQPKPAAYQAIAGHTVPVAVAFELDAAKRAAFRLGPYDHARPLVIDPRLVFENAFGGSGLSSAAAIALDAQGNIYAAGQTNSANFRVQSAAQNRAGGAPLAASANGGQSWVAVAAGSAAIRSIASAPAMPSTLYAATNEGVIKSTDGGTTWSAVGLAGGLTSPPVALAVDAGPAATVYAATQSSGIFVSADGGTTWSASSKGLLVPGSIPPTPASIMGLVADPGKPGTVFAVAQSPDFVYRSTDFGQTWRQVALPVPGGIPASVVFSPSDPNTIFLGQQTGAFLSSSDGGDTWTALSNQNVVRWPGLAVLPGNPPVLLAAGANQLARSGDGGNTWTTVQALSNGVVVADPRTAGVVYALDMSGLYRSSDSGQSWTKAGLPYPVTPMTLFVSAADSRVFIGQGLQTDAFVIKWSPDGSKILYSTYLGGSANDLATGLAVDRAGNAYVAGNTNSRDFPVSGNAFQKDLAAASSGFSQNAFVAKLSADGSQLIYSTLLGGGSEVAARIAVNAAGEAVVTGGTASPSFPVTPGASQSSPVVPCAIQSPFVLTSGTAFVSKLAADGGSLVFSTLLGGSCGTRAQAVAFDGNGNAWVGGFTDSPDFPVTNDALQPKLGGDFYDGFLARFSPSGSLNYATYVGGARYDTVTGIAFDPKDNIYLTGTSGGLPQPASPGAFASKVTVGCVIFSFGPGVYQATGSAFVLKLDAMAHTTLGLTYLGSPLCLYPSDIAVDATGEPWIAGPLSVFGSAPETAAPFQIGIGNGFASKFSADFKQLLFSTYFDSVAAIAADSTGEAYVAGQGALNNVAGTGQAYIAKIDPSPQSPVSLDAVQNFVDPASPSNTQGIGPGELLRILGKNMGPQQPTPGVVNGGVLASEVGGVQVTFDGVAAPLLAVSAGEIDLVAPFELAGKSIATVQVVSNGVKSNAVQVGIAGAIRFAGVTSGIPLQVLSVLNGDFTMNSASNPAQAGTEMILYVSGAGQTVPPSQNGQINASPLAAPPAPVQILLSNTDFNHPITLAVPFAGAAPGLVAGIFQINFLAPQSSMRLNLMIGPASAPFDVSVRQ